MAIEELVVKKNHIRARNHSGETIDVLWGPNGIFVSDRGQGQAQALADELLALARTTQDPNQQLKLQSLGKAIREGNVTYYGGKVYGNSVAVSGAASPTNYVDIHSAVTRLDKTVKKIKGLSDVLGTDPDVKSAIKQAYDSVTHRWKGPLYGAKFSQYLARKALEVLFEQNDVAHNPLLLKKVMKTPESVSLRDGVLYLGKKEVASKQYEIKLL